MKPPPYNPKPPTEAVFHTGVAPDLQASVVQFLHIPQKGEREASRNKIKGEKSSDKRKTFGAHTTNTHTPPKITSHGN